MSGTVAHSKLPVLTHMIDSSFMLYYSINGITGQVHFRQNNVSISSDGMSTVIPTEIAP